MNVVLIGSGNVAQVLGRLIAASAHRIIQVAARNQVEANHVAVSLGAAGSPIDDISMEGDIYIICVSDDSIEEVCGKLKLPGKVIVHTSGSVSKEVLRPVSPLYGVLYPVQSLRKELSRIPTVPFLVDGVNQAVREAVREFALSFSSAVQYAGDEERLTLHVAAVFVSNFTNHLYTLARYFCEQKHVDFRLLVPLIEEVASRVELGDPAVLQTGPAIRGDDETIARHMELLREYPALQQVYRLLTESIQLYHFNGE